MTWGQTILFGLGVWVLLDVAFVGFLWLGRRKD